MIYECKYININLDIIYIYISSYIIFTHIFRLYHNCIHIHIVTSTFTLSDVICTGELMWSNEYQYKYKLSSACLLVFVYKITVHQNQTMTKLWLNENQKNFCYVKCEVTLFWVDLMQSMFCTSPCLW